MPRNAIAITLGAVVLMLGAGYGLWTRRGGIALAPALAPAHRACLAACADARGWKEEDADAWWRRYESHDATTRAASEAPRTLQVALDGRLSRNQAAGV